MRLTDGMRWLIVGTLCAILFIGAIGTLTLIDQHNSPPVGCSRDGGVVGTRYDGNISTTYFICKDGVVVSLP